LDRLRHVRGGDLVAPLQVGEGAGDLQDAVVGARAQPQAGDGGAQRLSPDLEILATDEARRCTTCLC
jgi:hypothetical protein